MQKRLSRRRAIAAAGGTAAGAALLAACGGAGDSSGGDSTGLVSTVQDSSSKATPGGTWLSYVSSDSPGMDPMTNPASTVPPLANFAISRLFKYKLGTRENRPVGDVEGDAVASYEVAPDGLTLTMKLRPNMKFDPRPPTSGKNLTAADVLFSWKQYETLSGTRGVLAAAAGAGGPITSMTAPDDMTVVAKMSYPYAPLLPMLAYHWYMVIQPTEAEDKFNPKNEMRGSGPWMLEKYEPSAGYNFVKNPNWYLKDRPFLDRINWPIVTEYATGVSQFEAGNIWEYNVNQLDILPLKRRQPKMELLADDSFSRNPPQVIAFGWRPNSPFRDQRLRQAISMMVNRDDIIELNFAPSMFEKEGFAVDQRWATHISPGEEGRWIDPKNNAKDLGEGAKFFQLNIAEAKKLLSAGGWDSLETPFTYFATNRYSNAWPKQGEVLMDMLTQGGIKIRTNVVDYDAEYNPRYLNGKADFDGLAMLPSSAGPDIDTHFAAKYTPGGRATYIAETIPVVADLITAQRREFDSGKRAAIIKDIQRELAVRMSAVPVGGLSLGFSLQWPYLGNRGWFVQYAGANATELYTQFWLDKSKLPA
jgi:ABC-type transport system substrate-binding protein